MKVGKLFQINQLFLNLKKILAVKFPKLKKKKKKESEE